MKARYLLAIPALMFFSCNEPDEPTLVDPVLVIRPIRMSEPGSAREIKYSSDGKVSQIVFINEGPDGSVWTSTTDYMYDNNGRLTESTTDTGWRLVYHYTGDRITATDEYVSGVLSQQHHFTYNTKGHLVTKIATQDIPEEGGVIPVSREEYQYDSRGNVTVLELYYYSTMGTSSTLLSRFVFSDYDNKISSDEYFDRIAFNPLLDIRKNNAGKLEITNGSGVLTITETYAYLYHEKGYATQKTTHVRMYNGTEGDHTITYEFE